MFTFFTSNFDIQEKHSAFKDLPQNILLLGKIESTREYSFIKIDKIELADRENFKKSYTCFFRNDRDCYRRALHKYCYLFSKRYFNILYNP